MGKDKTAIPSPRKRLYLVCVHYGLSPDRDWHWDHRGLTINYNAVTPRLASDLAYLRHVLKPRRSDDGQLWEGFAFIFLDPGWTNLLKGVRGSAVRMAALGGDLSRVQAEIEKGLEKDKKLESSGPQRERIVTAGHLIRLLELLEAAAQGRDKSFYNLFVGGTRTLRYDAPKVIEAAIRIANIGSQVPLFRFDDDVIFYGQRIPVIALDENKRKTAADNTAKNILQLCNRYHTLSMDPQIRYFVYSGGYDAPPELSQDPSKTSPNDPRLLNGFATRILQLTELPKQWNPKTEGETEGTVKPIDVATFLKELYKFGANPFRQVISGAGLCLSDGAILDLPPYSNMHLNVMWIDDHLKYALHDELGHFGRWTRTHHPYMARVSEARFSQVRHIKKGNGPLFTYKDVRWHIQKYMTRLILGCIADAWLRQKPELKQTTRGLDAQKYEELAQSVPGVYADRFMDVLPGGWEKTIDGEPTDEKTKSEFKQKLWQRGRERLKELVTTWSDQKYYHTFLGLFVHGDSHERYTDFLSYFPKGMPQGLQKAVAKLPEQHPQARRSQPEDSLDDARLEEVLLILIDDFVKYLSLVQLWPFFVQSVRCFLNQNAQSPRPDLEWMFPAPLADNDDSGNNPE